MRLLTPLHLVVRETCVPVYAEMLEDLLGRQRMPRMILLVLHLATAPSSRSAQDHPAVIHGNRVTVMMTPQASGWAARPVDAASAVLPRHMRPPA